jgi:hypothetical protein
LGVAQKSVVLDFGRPIFHHRITSRKFLQLVDLALHKIKTDKPLETIIGCHCPGVCRARLFAVACESTFLPAHA